MPTEREENPLCRKSCASISSPCTYFFIYTALHFSRRRGKQPTSAAFFFLFFFPLVVEFETQTKYADPFIKASLGEDRGGKEVETAG